MKRVATWGILVGVCVLAAVLIWQWRVLVFPEAQETRLPHAGVRRIAWLDRVGWIGSPGALHTAHAELTRDCQACHVPFRRVADLKCFSCHAQNTALLQRRDTAFHAEATRCMTCHVEHQGRTVRISRMEHAILDPMVGCGTCHVDRHQTFFGDRCEVCHRVETWKVAGFRHPSPQSRVCAECHQPPPSHLMMHFQMVDQMVTQQWDVTVEQCWRCHTTNHWNNIVGIGSYKHH